MQISILSANQLAHPTKTPGKTTPKLDLAYKNLTFGGKVEGKALFSFGTQEAAYKALLGAVHGDVFDIDVVKNASGYNDWVSAKKSDGSTQATSSPSPQAGQAGGKSSAYTPSKSSYPTDEERAKTQVYIVRQSNITAAINLLSVGAKTPPKLEEVIVTAKRFEDHVFGTGDTTVGAAVAFDAATAFDDLDDMPS